MIYDLIVVGAIVAGGLIGAWRGLAVQVAGILSIVLGCLGGAAIAKAYAKATSGEHPLLVFIVSYALISLICYGLAAAYRKKLEEKKLERWDAHLGGVLGLFNGLVKVSILIFFAAAAAPSIVEHLEGRPVSPLVGGTIRAIFAVLPEEVVEAAMPLVDRIRSGG